ncbi:hypothetical protein WJX73_004390 [Symbiochloris irregularis]|uniref:BEACH domain-containing protein n=1 Tax=Symbiochloris irregularis TaxID=706552 RepID=A0AAW1NKZ6_9CHLO
MTKRWCERQVSNLHYLLQLNHLAGRRMGDSRFHPLVPWILDMTVDPETSAQDGEMLPAGWRDLSCSKWRLTKGDEQLDFTYASSDPPHHISDEALSELTYCIYKARRLPQDLLEACVRSTFAANEYPASMQRLYEWSPDECIPEFYTDASLLQSLHAEMPDLTVPAWAADAAGFVRKHRMALESEDGDAVWACSMQALGAVCRMLPAPAILQQVVQPLLVALPKGPHVALALVNLAHDSLSVQEAVVGAGQLFYNEACIPENAAGCFVAAGKQTLQGRTAAAGQAEHTARLIEGVGWLAPRSGPSAAARGRGSLPHAETLGGQAAPGTSAAADWQWLPPGHLDLPLSSADMWSTPASSALTGESWWQRPWRLSTVVIGSWRAHKEGLHLLAAHDDEESVVTAGRGIIEGRDCEVLRCWRLSDTTAGVQYSGHGAAALQFGGPAQAASQGRHARRRDEQPEFTGWVPKHRLQKPGHVDAGRGASLACWPGGQASGSVSCLSCGHPSLLSAGSTTGQAALLDARCGAPASWWRAHTAAVSSLCFADASQHHLVTASMAGAMMLWDIRKVSGLLSSPASSKAPFSPALVHTFPEQRDSVEGLVPLEGAVISWAGALVSLASLQAPHHTSASPLQSEGDSSSRGSSNVALAGLALLPVCRLLLLADDAGRIRVCR